MKRALSHIYGMAIHLRNAAFDRGLFRVRNVPVPVISVGNITAGGTGKTPVVEYLAGHFLRQGLRPAVVTRGYRRESRGSLLVSDGAGTLSSARQGGDEAVQIAAKFSGLIVIADEVRSRGCRRAVDEFSANIIVLDDAYQHRAVHRDLDIVVIDASEDFNAQLLLPAGRLREPLENLRRANVILLSKCEAETALEKLHHAIAAYTRVPVYATRFVPRKLRRLGSDEVFPLDALRETPLGCFCGIGNPGGFRRTLDGLQTSVALCRDFPDHHWYSREDLDVLNEQGNAKGVGAWITTEKDAVRLKDGEEWRRLGRVYYPEMEVEFSGDSRGFSTMLDACSARGSEMR
ncbi:MAG: tetraacyldisaccharide 4'-kinase [Bacteroidota bacterium]